MLREINDFFHKKFYSVFIFQQVNLLRVVHNENTLLGICIEVILNVFTVRFKSDEFTACQLIDFLLGNFMTLGRMKLDLIDLVYTATGLGKVNLLIIASN